MEEDSAGNITDMEKLAKFSVSSALQQWFSVVDRQETLVSLKRYLSIPKWQTDLVENCLNDIAEMMLRQESILTDEFVHLFGPIMLDLLERTSNVSMNAQLKHELMCILLGKLVTRNSTVLRFTLCYFEKHPAPFQLNALFEPPQKRMRMEDGAPSELALVTASYQLLTMAPEFFRNKWEWSCFMKRFFDHTNPEIRWITCQCLAKICAMPESEILSLVLKTLSEEEHRLFSLKHFIKQPNRGLAFTKSQLDSSEVTKETLSGGIVDVEGVLLPRYAKTPDDCESLVPVTSTRGHLQSIALAITSNRPVLVTGPVGCGKTCLVEYVAALTGRTMENQGLLKVQLGDQTDAKVLLGTYHSTDIPGEFVWTAGALTQAVREGRWLLLEDIDYAPMDVVSLLLPVIETRTLNVPGHGDVIRAAPDFQLLATQRLHNNEGAVVNNAATMLKKMWRRLIIEPLSRSELLTVIEIRYPNLTPLADKLLDAYYLLNGNQEDGKIKFHDRVISPRDFFKWCQRISTEFRLDQSSSLTSINSQLHLFQDAMDCFTACLVNRDRRLQLSEDIGAKLNLLKAKAEFYNNSYKPTFNSSDDAISIGRVTLDRMKKSSQGVKATFSWTRNSSVLLERLAVCVRQFEPVLLVGETGTGKTSTVQYLAQLLGHRLLVINLNQQSDSADLLGGYKPVDIKYKVGPIRQEFEELFQETFSLSQNAKFLSHIATCYANRRWNDLLRLMNHSQQSALQKCSDETRPGWEQLGFKLQQLRTQIRHADTALAFSFVEGSLVQALKRGDWVLLDEINLASAETLECLSGLLESQRGSLFLLERGDREPIERSSEFRLFAAMNPATDVGKKQLPTGLRSRFTEFFVDEISSPQDLATLVGDYLRDLNLTSSQVDGIVRFYQDVRGEALRSLTDGTGRQPHYSLRTLCRALMVAASNPCGNVARSLYEGFCLSFLTQLDRSSHPLVENLVTKHIVGKKNLKSVLRQTLPQPRPGWNGQSFIQVEGYWVTQGDLEPSEPSGYILTDSVRRNLKDLVRVVSLGRLPVLLQGETSVGKTSLICYLAQLTGNKCVRVNNHEHTDLQEYVGSYTADVSGKLVFREGVLVDAMRKGYWLILDELNLAPSEVLEALNRLLDDNRELFITETQENVKAHPRFLLFATQNPPGGLYGGRKLLSRAFRNRFVELHFDEIPSDELEIILHQRCAMPPSYCKRLVAVMRELQLRRRGSAAFAGKAGFMTLRDLFRWAERYRLATNSSSTFYDWDRHLADEGYLVLAGRVRKDEDAQVIREVLEKQFKTRVDPQHLFTLGQNTSPVTRPILEAIHASSLSGFEHLVWTFSLRRLAVLVGQALRFVEPILLVGDTGCGKTTVCQFLAGQRNCQLLTVNCHQYSEGSDFLGGLRPVRNHDRNVDMDGDTSTEGVAVDRLFEWIDGPLVMSMKGGHVFLADEISLADDSVLERLNSVLEPERSLLLAEKACGSEPEIVKAADGFRFVSTMNPGGDYGKKELSPALRNRLTEIWGPISREKQEITDIVEHNLRQPWITLGNGTEERRVNVASTMVDFIEWFSNSDVGRRSTVSIRDILSWVQFINTVTVNNRVDTAQAYVHGGCLVFLDSIGNQAAVETAIHQLCRPFFSGEMILGTTIDSISSITGREPGRLTVVSDDHLFGVEPFFIDKGKLAVPWRNPFTFQAPSTAINLIRLLRALQLKKPLLLEGSPGVGKTSLVAALAEASGHELVRINLSEQTDVSDLFGADLPVEGSETGGHFQWRDGPLLRALKEGHWIVLDELNLASQSVLEGLNAVLDHRGELYIPELGRSFHVRPEMTKLFACQNPLKQGGARKGLPRSFLNRFTQVYVEPLSRDDLLFIAQSVYSQIDVDVITKMVAFNERLVDEVLKSAQWGVRGGPWEFNLRDIFRWCQAVHSSMLEQGEAMKCSAPGRFVGLIYADRMRSPQDKEKMLQLYENVFGPQYPLPHGDRHVYVTDSWIQVGNAVLPRGMRRKSAGDGTPLVLSSTATTADDDNDLLLLHRNLQPLESLMHCIRFNWMSILVGRRSSGKTSLVRLAAQLTGHPLDVLTTNSAMDTTELLGGFEQGDLSRSLEQLAAQINGLCQWTLRHQLMNQQTDEAVAVLELWESYSKLTADAAIRTATQESQHLENRIRILLKLADQMRSVEQVCIQLADIKKKLDAILEQISRSVNCGGRFEWVDSLLVKALRDGHWLLIDNVNLCTSSVLDRLNALLEPGGVLTLSERGVIDGEIPTVRPHPEFRLFLALDPRHGEISRAMRNRGVEIYLFGPEEVEYPLVDAHSILQAAGLRSPLLRRTLQSFHQSICRGLASTEQPTLTELLQAASLAAQRLEMFSANPLSCLDDACVDVYIKSIRLASDREAARSLLSQALETGLETEHEEHSSGDEYHCPIVSTRELQLSSTLARIRQAVCMVEQQLKENAAVVQDSILLFYLSSSFRDVDWRRNLLEQTLGRHGEEHGRSLVVHQHLYGTLKAQLEQITTGRDGQLLDLPWDPRWFHSICQHHVHYDVQQSDRIDVMTNNRLSLNLFWRLWNLAEEPCASGQTVASFWRAIASGSLAEEAAPHGLFVALPRFLAQLDQTLDKLMTSADVHLNNEEWVALWHAVRWRIDMKDLNCLPVNTENLDATVACMTQYWTWLQKRALPVVRNLLQRFPVAPSLAERADQVSITLSSAGSAWELASVLSRRLRRLVDDQPVEPFIDESHAQLARVIGAIFSTCSLSGVAAERAGQLMRELSQCIIDTCSADAAGNAQDLDSISSRLTRLLEQLNVTDNSITGPAADDERQICSLLDHLTLLQHWAASARRRQDTASILNQSVASSLNLVPTMSAALLRSHYAINCSIPWTESRLSHWEAIINLSTSRRISLDFLEAAPEAADARIRRLATTAPVLSLAVANVVHKTGIALGESIEKKNRLELLKEILWNNAAQIQRQTFDPMVNDRLLVAEEMHRFLRAVCYALRLPAPDASSMNDHAVLQQVFQSWNGHVPPVVIQVIQSALELMRVDDADVCVGSAWLLLGLARCLLLAANDNVDPVEKRKLKVSLRQRESERLGRFLKVHRLFQTLLTGSCASEDGTQHPHVAFFDQRSKQLQRQNKEDETRRPTWRPTNGALYHSFTKDVHHYIKSVASPQSVQELAKKLREYNADAHDSKLILSQAELWISAQRTFYRSLKNKFVDYPDLIVPLLTGIGQMIHGAEVLTRRVEKLAQSKLLQAAHVDGSIDDVIADLVDRPSRLVASSDGGALKLAQLCTSMRVGRLFDVVFDSTAERDENKKILLMSALKEVQRHVSHGRRIESEAWTTELTILDALAASWNTSEDLERILAEEKESLYKSRTQVHEGELKDAEADRRALERYFPSYDNEFSDTEQILDEAMETEETPAADALNFKLTEQDLIDISQNHVDLLSLWTRSMALTPSPESVDPTNERPGNGGFLMRYPFLTRLSGVLCPSLSTQFDRRLVSSHISFMHHTTLETDVPDRSTPGKFDFYHDPCIDEAILCRPVLEQLDGRIDHLLSQWPGHATLVDIKKLDQRILGFSVDSPLMKLVTGLELLLTKCQEWEMNAHKGVSIAESIQSVSRLILRWRTLELDCWKTCLDSVERRVSSTSAKLWFHLYSTVASLVSDEFGGAEDPSAENLMKIQNSLRQFMEHTSLGQYDGRLRMLWAFTSHVELQIRRSESRQQDESRRLYGHQLLRIFWNAFLFYSQFGPALCKKKQALRAPIDKKVKDFVKIMRWNDINYYALKEAVNKAHNTLHKHMKEWQTLLNQPVKSFLNEPGIDQETESVTQGLEGLNSDIFISRLEISGTYSAPPSQPETSYPVLSRLPSLSTKSRKLCGELLRKSPFEQRIREVDDLVGIIASTSADLQKLQVIGGSDKERQKREAKSISMRKRKSLSELFRCLQQLGISYRRGSSMWKETLPIFNEILPILEVNASLHHLPKRGTQTAIQRFWHKCPLYYTRCIARLTTLGKLLEKPASDLGPDIVERCKGFAAQFMAIIQDQWKQCSRTHDSLVSLRLIVAQLDGTVPNQTEEECAVPEFHTVVEYLNRLWGLLVDGLVVLDEFEGLMKACPDSNQKDVFQLRMDPQHEDWTVVTKTESSAILSACSGIRSRLTQLRRDLEKHFHLFWTTSQSSWIFHPSQWKSIGDGYEMLKELQVELEHVAARSDRNNFGASIHQLSRRFGQAVDKFQSHKTPSAGDSAISAVGAKDVEKICQSMLHGIQEVYKKYVAVREGEEPADEEESDEFEENHLTDRVMQEMVADLNKLLKVDTTVAELTRLVESLSRSHQNPQILSVCTPVIDQYTYVVEYYFAMQLAMLRTSSKLQSVLLNVFNQLLEKGFCLPSELEESSGGSGTKFEEIESGGLGDGQGANDVSDQIDNEDQLEGAQQQGQEGEENEGDENGPKEEENAIEMSEDFDAQMQDREKKEGEEDEDKSEGEEDDDNMNKEMGETGTGADQLEEKLWGSDEEEEGEEEKDQEEGQGDGEKKESQMTAKTGDDSDGDDDHDGADKKKEKQRQDPAEEEDPDKINDDQIDPYHGSHEPQPEPEPLDVPDDLNLDDGDPDRDDGADNEPEENPFDIDAAKKDAEMEETDQKDEEQEAGGDEEEGGEDGEAETHQADAKDQRPEGETDDEDGDKDGDQEMEKADDAAPTTDQEEQKQQQQAAPSLDRPAESEAQPAADDAVKGSQDKTAQKAEDEKTEEAGTNQEADNEDNEGVGMAESRQTQGHEGQEKSKVNRQLPNRKEEEARGKSKPKKPGQSDPERALADQRKERVLQVHSTATLPETPDEENQGPEPDDDASEVGQDALFEHIKKVDQRYDALARDAATEEQAKEQLTVQDKEQDPVRKEEEDQECDDVTMQEDKQEPDQSDVDQVEPERMTGRNQKKGRQRGDPNTEEVEPDAKMEVEGETTTTLSVNRGPESSYVTRSELLMPPESNVTMEEIEQLRGDIEQRLSTWTASQIDDNEGQETWKQLEMVTSGLAQDLCEQLRLILEPSQASRLKGDYRTGKRLNMRKVIPYIASQFRKDRIWLRRTKPAQRNYQIVLAVDDSSSMADNRSKELAFESVALISKALCLLEAGQLGVVSFGEEVQLLHPLHDTFSDSSGPRILQQFTFEQKKTRISKMVDFVTAMMSQARTSSMAQSSSSTAQLLLIVSDGRGLFSEGTECVLQSIRRAKQSGLFMVFVIVDNPDSKDSILDIRAPVFDNTGKLLGIKPYLDNFPFPFYVILRDIQTLPVVLSDALRQWFELVTSATSL